MKQDEIIELAWKEYVASLEGRPHPWAAFNFAWKAANAIEREALAQPEQEPVAWMDVDGKTFPFVWNVSSLGVQQDETLTPLYTHPPRRTWVGLEGEEIRNSWEEATKPDRSTMTIVTSFARAIEAKLKEKNT